MNDTCESIIIKGRRPRRLVQAFASGLFASLASVATAATFVVSSPVDNAVAPNLRRAISDANANPGLDVIVFDFAVYPATLTFSTPLPDITESVLIDGTDPGGCLADMPPRIQLDGIGLGPNANGLAARGTAALPIGVTIKGLAVYRFGGTGILLEFNTNSVIAGNHLGTDGAGMVPLPNGVGLALESCNEVIVGGTAPCQHNVISGNQRDGVEIYNGADHRVLNNLVGLSANGQWAVPNRVGVALHFGERCQVGSLLPGEGNVISRNQEEGVLVSGGLGVAMESRIEGNFIGTLAGGGFPAPNGGDGIHFFGGPTRNHVRGNVIAHNGGSGVMVLEGIDNEIVENAIFKNSFLGIDISPRFVPNPNDPCDPDEGPNRQQNFPLLGSVLSFASSVQIDGVLDSEPGKTYRLDFYWNGACDLFGFGEGHHYIGQSVVSNLTAGQCAAPFNLTFPVHVPPGAVVTATATHPGGSTSEFSPCVQVLAGGSNIVNHAGLPHTPVGNATLTPQAGGTLEVRGAGGGSNGVQTALGRAQGWIGRFDKLRMEPGQKMAMEINMPLPPEEFGMATAKTEIAITVDTTPPIWEIASTYDPTRGPLVVNEVDENGKSLHSYSISNGGSYPLMLCSSNGGLNVLAAGVVRLKSGVSAMMWQFVDDGYGPGCGTTNPSFPPKPPKVMTLLIYPDVALSGAGGFTAAGAHPCEPWPDCLIPGYILDVKVILDPGCLSCPDRGIRLGEEWVQQFDSLHQLAGDLNTIVSGQGPQPLPWLPRTLMVQSHTVGGELTLDLIPSGSSIPLPPPDGGPDPHLLPDFASAARYICLDLDIIVSSIPGFGASPAGFDRWIHYIVEGPVRPKPGEPVQDKLFFRGGVRSWTVSADFTGSGATGAVVEFYFRGARVMEPMPLEMLQIESLPSRVAASTSVSPTGAPGFALLWPDAIFGPHPWPWDELRIRPLAPANPMMWLSRVRIEGGGIERLEILGEGTRPARPGPLSIARSSGGGVTLTYPTEGGRPYQIESTESLSLPAWELLESFMGDGSIRQINDPPRAGQNRFYRLIGL